METSLSALSDEIATLIARSATSVVAINGRRRSHSSGVHWRQGIIVTAEHSIRRDEEITVTLAGGKSAGASLLGRDPGTDLALLKVEDPGIPTAAIAAGGGPRAGDLALVIGRSPNSGPNASMGIISAVSGPWRTWRGGTLDAYIRLGAAVFAGSSGGAVIDHRGDVAGIATSALSRVAGLAIPASTVNRVVDQILMRERSRTVPGRRAAARSHAGVIPEEVFAPERARHHGSRRRAGRTGRQRRNSGGRHRV